MGFGQTSLSGVRLGFMPPQLKTKAKQKSAPPENILVHYQNYFPK
jgi:hypothetical protein